MTIVLTDVTKAFGNQVVVSHVSLTVEDRELLVLLGSSGSGKSTLLRMIAGLAFPDAGRIELHGKDVTYLPPQSRDTGFVFQNYAVFKHMTVAQNVEFGLKIRKVAVVERRTRRDQLLDMVGLSGLAERYPHQLSGGQRQRVALARALAYQPSVLLLDEPFGALDLKIRSQLRRTLKETQRELGVTAILVTHDQEEAFELGDRVGILERGRLVEIGDAQRLYHRPTQEFSATFLGNGNVLVGRFLQGEIRLGDIRLRCPSELPHHDEGAPIRILFRPEAVQVSEREFPSSGPVQSLGAGKVKESIFAGETERLRVEMWSLQGARPLKPALQYGERFVTIEVARPSSERGSTRLWSGHRELWFGVEDFHVLTPSGLKVIIWPGAYDGDNQALRVARELLRVSLGSLVIFDVTHGDDKAGHMVRRLEELCAEYQLPVGPHVMVKPRSGALMRELTRELQEEFYDLVVLPGQSISETERELLPGLTQRILFGPGLPVLLTGTTTVPFQKILICTAGGEPGKNDVIFGARVARHTRSETTIFHVVPPGATPKDIVRAEKHLEDACAVFDAYEVPSQRIRASGNFREALDREIQSKEYQLVVLGAAVGGGASIRNTASHIIDSCGASVLLVPSN